MANYALDGLRQMCEQKLKFNMIRENNSTTTVFLLLGTISNTLNRAGGNSENETAHLAKR